MKKKSKEKLLYRIGHEVPLSNRPQDAFLDQPTLQVVQEASKRIIFVMFCIALFFCIIVGRLFYLTVYSGERHLSFTPVLQEETRFIRKNFLDRNGLVIATSLATTDLSVNPSKVKNPSEVAKNLARIFEDMSEEEIYKKLTAQGHFRYIKRYVTPTERNAINWLGYYFLDEQEGEKRIYPHSSLFSHILGLVNLDNQGVSGLERGFEEQIKKKDIQLSLDTSIQSIVYQILEKNIKKHQATSGLAVVMNVRTGEVLASVSLPDYNPNFPIRKSGKNLFNQVVSGVYEFGSIFKLFTVACGLEHNLVYPSTLIEAKEPIKLQRKTITDYHPQNRDLLVPEVLFHSSNIGSANIAFKNGADRQIEFFKRFYFDQPLSFGLVEKSNVLFPKNKKIADITLANLSFGYALSVSPLHIVSGVSALVNGGFYHLPVFTKKKKEDTLQYQILSSDTSAKMRAMMWGVMNWNSKKNSIERLYRVGGKTGSANLLEKGKYVQGKLRTSFVGAFPMENPEITLLVMMENPKKLKENFNLNAAGWSAKPTALEMIEKIAPYVSIFPEDNFKIPAYLKKSIDKSLEHKKQKGR